jgi:hypothetical protein
VVAGRRHIAFISRMAELWLLELPGGMQQQCGEAAKVSAADGMLVRVSTPRENHAARVW